jgi:diaminohydroxyphosphoribosylaminopyrimidine deaminase/5-amino-6-(5-phosphoribosylamino)uracil reductase
MVGCVIVAKGEIIGEGYHRKYGHAHAEVDAIEAVREKEKLEGATLYVSLEPCFHHGKTPPCVDLIIRSGIHRIVIGCKDPNPKVAGKSIQKLTSLGREVRCGVLEKEAIALNKRFFTFQLKQRPYITLKWAQSKDGYMDRIRIPDEKGVHWISQPETRTLVHQWRSEEHALLVGRKTAEVDNPALTVREVSGQNPVRVVIDSNLQLSEKNAVFQGTAPTIVINKMRSEVVGNVTLLKLQDIHIKSILNALHHLGICSLLVEGGSRTLHHFIFQNIWDEARVIVGTDCLLDGLKAPVLSAIPTRQYFFGKDQIIEYQRT